MSPAPSAAPGPVTAFPVPVPVPPARRTAVLLAGAAVGWGLVLLALARWLPIVTVQSPPVFATAAPTAAPTAALTGAVGPSDPASQVFVTEPRVSLVAQSGYGVLLLVLLPLLAALVVGLLVRTGAAERSRAAARTAWALAVLVVLAGVAGFVTFLIGGAVVPMGVLLVGACICVAPPSGRRGYGPGAFAAPLG
ncbi:hypothetical protein OG455_35230 [Kitasatospora sp. NBC_01287]|uniref:hypothetical protein n=1 Tax=Kitasatospora sp. NBC_01287 TaxID=2903573 RepID=UPI0022567050|nr:hypothetical protein [Kitasatospora sp. NBC_01287]MCX4750699.1 hypothetical protein [Kitasatospora sp. NBC_01287]